MTSQEGVGTVIAALGFVGGFVTRYLPFFKNGKSHDYSSEPETVKFRTEMAIAIKQQAETTEQIAGHMDRHASLLERLTEFISDHDNAEREVWGKVTETLSELLRERRRR